MRFDRAFILASRLVAFSGLLAVFLTREAPDWLVLPALALTVFSAVYPGRLRLSKGALTSLLVAGAAFAVFDFMYIGGSLLVAGADFMAVLTALKLLSLDEDKDFVQLFALGFFLLLASTGLSTEIRFFGVFLLFFVSLAWSLVLMTAKGDSERLSGRPPRWRVGRGFFVGTALLTLLSTLFTLAIFLVIPRVGIGYFSRKAGGLLKVSGFSDRVELGAMGGVLLDPTAVMRVEITGRRNIGPDELYWRGRSFDHYDGKLWEDTLSRRVMLGRDYDGTFRLGRGLGGEDEVITQRITLEPLDTRTLFALYPPMEVKGDFPTLMKDASLALSLPYPPGRSVGYTVSSLAGPGPGPGAAGGVDAYLQLPPGPGNVVKLSAGVTSGAKAAREKAERVRDYLLKNYRYTLDPPRDLSLAPVDDFLLRSKAGYCEHFATAMALMLRASGVPSRLVSGFRGGEWNGYGKYYVVRAKDAHAWVEALIPGEGWTRFDPTPPSVSVGRAATAGAGQFFDFLRYKWDRYVVFYGLRDQAQALRSVSDALRRAGRGLKGLAGWKGPGPGRFSAPAFDKKYAGYAALAALLAAALVVFLRRRTPRAGMRDSAVRFYNEMLRLMSRRGFVKRAGQTPLEFARAAARARPELSGAVAIAEKYNRVRFGGVALGEAELRELREAFEALRNSSGKDGTA